MSTIAQEIMSIATAHGYQGTAQPTIAEAVNALADTLAGEDVAGGRTIAEAVRNIAPYVGGGGAATHKLYIVGEVPTSVTNALTGAQYAIVDDTMVSWGEDCKSAQVEAGAVLKVGYATLPQQEPEAGTADESDTGIPLTAIRNEQGSFIQLVMPDVDAYVSAYNSGD